MPNKKQRIIGPDISGSSNNYTSHFENFKTEIALSLILFKSIPSSKAKEKMN